MGPSQPAALCPCGHSGGVPSVACNRMIETNVSSQLGRVADAATVAVKGRHVKLCVARVCEKERENESNPSNNGVV